MRVGLIALLTAALLCAQTPPAGDPKQRAREARDLSRGGSETIPRLEPYLSDPDPSVRLEAVKSIVAIGTQHSVGPLIQATRDSIEEIQIRAVDGIVNFYLPGYVSASRIGRVGSAIRSQFDKEDDQVIEPAVFVRPDAVAAIGKVASGGISMEARANAARGVGVLRGAAAIPDLVKALHSKNTPLIFESLIALQKIGDTSAGSQVSFLIRDFEERVQIAAIETTGVLRNRNAIPDLQKLYPNAKNDKVRSAVLTALSMVPDESSRRLFTSELTHKNDRIRASAAEGLARLGKSSDLPTLERAFNEEKKMMPRLAAAFGMVLLGKVEPGEFSALTYLVNALNSRAYRNVAEPYLIETAKNPAVRENLGQFLKAGTVAEKTGLARVMAASGGKESIPHLEALAKDPNTQVAEEGVRSLRNLRARNP